MIKYKLDECELVMKDEPQKCMVLYTRGWAYSDTEKEIDMTIGGDAPYRIVRYDRDDVQASFHDVQSSYCGFTIEVILCGDYKSLPLNIYEKGDYHEEVTVELYNKNIWMQKTKLQINSLKQKTLVEYLNSGKCFKPNKYVIMGNLLEQVFYGLDDIIYLDAFKEFVLTGWQVARQGENKIEFEGAKVNVVERIERDDVKKVFEISDKSIENGFVYRVTVQPNSNKVTFHIVNEAVGRIKVCLPVDSIDGGIWDEKSHLDKDTLNEYKNKYGIENVDFKKKEKVTAIQEVMMNTRPYVATKEEYGSATMDCDISIVVAVNSPQYVGAIINKFNLLNYNGIQLVLAGSAELLKISNIDEKNIVLVDSESLDKEELVVSGYNAASKKYVLIMDQEDDFDEEFFAYLTDVFAQGYEYVYADYDLMYAGEQIVRVNRVDNFLEVENSPLSMVACVFNKLCVGSVDNYTQIIEKLKKCKKVFHSDKIFYHYNCVEDNWGAEATKAIAFYLTQYHITEENNKWWGEGFTEWMNVKRGYPMFDGHDQPRIPAGQQYYDLVEDRMVQYKQVELAKQFGVHGFCYYYYWFKGKRLLRKPLDQYIENHELDLPYCICWANETWSRRWDGKEHEILMQQVHNEQTDRDFIYDVIPMFKDERYIKINGKPLLLIYRFELFSAPNKTIKLWREICKEEGVGDIHIAIVQSFDAIDHRIYGADSSVEFPPHKINAIPNIVMNDRLQNVREEFEGRVYSYKHIVDNLSTIEKREYNLYPGCMLKWDNTARKLTNSDVFHEFTPELYRKWLIKNHHYTRLYNEENIMFINAWNEWAEGSYLEPDETYGTKLLEITSEVCKSK